MAEPKGVVPSRFAVARARAQDVVRWILEEVVGEAVLAVVACLAFAAVVGAAVWGWKHHPAATTVIGTASGALVIYGAWILFGPPSHRTRVSALAALATLIVIVLVGAVLSYCPCGLF